MPFDDLYTRLLTPNNGGKKSYIACGYLATSPLILAGAFTRIMKILVVLTTQENYERSTL